MTGKIIVFILIAAFGILAILVGINEEDD